MGECKLAFGLWPPTGDESSSGWTFLTDSDARGGHWAGDAGIWWPSFATNRIYTEARLPLWMIALPLGFTAALLYRNLRPRAGHCACGYNLTGLAAGALCPECGVANGAGAQPST